MLFQPIHWRAFYHWWSGNGDSGMLGTIGFRTTASFDSGSIRLVRGELRGRGSPIVIMPNLTIALSSALSPDFDGDGEVGFNDFVLFAGAFGAKRGENRFDARFDLDSSGDIGFGDFVEFAGSFGQPVGTGGGSGSGSGSGSGGGSGGVGTRFQDCTECPVMVEVPTGSFIMGSPPIEEERLSDEGPQHRVEIGYRLAVGVYEVTFAEWDACVEAGGCNGYHPADKGWGRGNLPVIHVSWNDAQA